MDDKSKHSHTDDHNQLPSDEVTRKKIDKHLSDIDDTISEEDIKNINTVTGAGKASDTKDTETKKNDEDDQDDEEPEKEAPTPWEILGE
jgi:ribosomal protein L12E/L44/L45/RPP1/RPP2